MSSEHRVGMVEVKGGDVGLEYSFLAVLSVECTVSIVRQLAKGVFFPVIILDCGHCENCLIFCAPS